MLGKANEWGRSDTAKSGLEQKKKSVEYKTSEVLAGQSQREFIINVSFSRCSPPVGEVEVTHWHPECPRNGSLGWAYFSSSVYECILDECMRWVYFLICIFISVFWMSVPWMPTHTNGACAMRPCSSPCRKWLVWDLLTNCLYYVPQTSVRSSDASLSC